MTLPSNAMAMPQFRLPQTIRIAWRPLCDRQMVEQPKTPNWFGSTDFAAFHAGKFVITGCHDWISLKSKATRRAARSAPHANACDFLCAESHKRTMTARRLHFADKAATPSMHCDN
jgi:hypothetical protein